MLRLNNMLVFFGLAACTACVPKTVTSDSADPSETGDLWSGWSIDPDTLPAGSAPCRAPLVAELEYVIDGDTAWLDTGDDTVKVRFIGINAAEMGYKDEPSECYAEEATEYLESWLKDEFVWLTFDVECEDDYGRWLAYLHHDDTEDGFVQRRLLNEGYVTEYKVQPNDTFAETFEADESRARALSKGRWSACD